MNSSSERLVFFVTPAQKRVLAARAARMGISLSELVRRAVLAFDDTGEEMRAAGLVDRLAAASEASRNDTLRRLVQEQTSERERAGIPAAAASGKTETAAADEACQADSTPADCSSSLPVAAAVARALIAQAEAQAAARADEQADEEAQALVARVIGSSSAGSV